jgi:hypothetical protein
MQQRAQRDTTFGVGRAQAAAMHSGGRSQLLVTGFLQGERATIRVRETSSPSLPVAIDEGTTERARVLVRDALGRVIAESHVPLVPLAHGEGARLFAGLVDLPLATVRGGSVELVRDGRSMGRSSLDTP